MVKAELNILNDAWGITDGNKHITDKSGETLSLRLVLTGT